LQNFKLIRYFCALRSQNERQTLMMKSVVVNLPTYDFKKNMKYSVDKNDRYCAGGSFVMTGIKHPAVQKLIEISRLETVLSIVPSIQESIDFVMMEELQRELQGNDDTSEE